MGTIQKFEDLNIWQDARKLCHEVFEIILENRELRDFSFKDQINRSSSSIMDNIAEGFDRGGNKEFRQFLSIARASAGEVKSQLYRAKDRNYIDADNYNKLLESIDNLIKMMNGFLKYLRSSENKGIKFRNN